MRRVAVLACAIALGACRGIIGIEDLQLADGGADAASSAPADGSAPPSDGAAGDGAARDDAGASDAGASDGALDPNIQACVNQGAAGCGMCCRDTFKEDFPALEALAAKTGCTCRGQSGDCTVECTGMSGGLCDGGGMPPMSCGGCLDPRVATDKDCMDAVTECRGNPSCAPAIDCLHACFGGP